MALQEWFDYFKEDGDIEEAFNIINKAKNSDLKFYYDCLIEDIRRKLLTDKIVICLDTDDEEMEKRSILTESMIKHKEITGCSWDTLLNFCKAILDKESDCTCVFVPYTIKNEEYDEIWDSYIYTRNKNHAIDEIYKSSHLNMIQDISIGAYSDEESEQYRDDKCNTAGKRLYDLFKKEYKLNYCYDIFEALDQIQRIGFESWYNLECFNLNGESDNKIRIQYFNDIADEIIDFMFKSGKEIILDINKGIVNVNNSPLRFYILSKDIEHTNKEIEEEIVDYIKIASELIDYAIRREEVDDSIEVIRTEDTITYRVKMISDLIEMARKDKVELFYNEDNLDATIEYSTIPESFREYLEDSDDILEDIHMICDRLLLYDKDIRFINLSDAKTEDMDPYYTYTTNEKILIHNMNNSIITNTLIENIKKYKETRPFNSENDYRKCEEQINPTVDEIFTNSYYGNEQELWENYKDLIIKYHVYNMKDDITKAARKFKDHIVVIKPLGADQRVSFYMTICDTVIDFFKKESSLTLYTDGRNLDEIKLPMGIYLFLDDFKQNLKFIRGIVDFAIERAGIQDLIEITEDAEKITFKNKLFN